MPTYSYRCTECATAFDIQQAFADDSLTECPTCGGKLRKVFSAVGVSFTGSGFYRNDSRAAQKKSESTSGSGTSTSSSGSSSTSSSDSSSTSKPASVPSAKPAPASTGSPAAS